MVKKPFGGCLFHVIVESNRFPLLFEWGKVWYPPDWYKAHFLHQVALFDF